MTDKCVGYRYRHKFDLLGPGRWENKFSLSQNMDPDPKHCLFLTKNLNCINIFTKKVMEKGCSVSWKSFYYDWHFEMF